MNRSSFRKRPLSTLLCAALALAGMPAVFAADVSTYDVSTYKGPELYRRFCASCHGKNGEGDGPVAPFFKLKPPNLTGIASRSGGTFPAERVRRMVDGREMPAQHGVRAMPVWGMGFTLSADDPTTAQAAAEIAIARLVEYLRTIQKVPAI